MIVIERAYAGIGGDHIGGRDGPLVVLAGPGAEIVDLFRADLDPVLVGGIRNVGRADQGIFAALVGDREHDPPVAILEEIGVIALMPFRDDDMAALHKAQVGLVFAGAGEAKDFVHPAAGRIHDGTEPACFGPRG